MFGTKIRLNKTLLLIAAICSIAFVTTGCGGGQQSIGDQSSQNTGTTPSDPAPSDPAPSDPAPSDPAPSDPGPAIYSLSVSWDPPTTKLDGTGLDDLAGYVVLYGTEPGVYTEVIVDNPGLATYVIEGLYAGTYYVSVRAVNTQGLRSPYSNIAVGTAI